MASIGIDFGTSKACVAVYRSKKVDVIANEQENRLTPCYVGFGDDEIHIGETAKQKAAVNVKNTVYYIKQLMGRNVDYYDYPQFCKIWGFEICLSKDTNCHSPLAKVEFHGKEKQLRAEEVGAMIIRKMKEMAVHHLKTQVARAVISIPACFNNMQRIAVKNAGIIAGFTHVTLINEPTAAAIAFNINNEASVAQWILIFDMGAGSLDVSICQRSRTNITVISSCGNAHLGGRDFDALMTNFFMKEFKQIHRMSTFNDKKSKTRLQFECEKAKKILSTSNQASIQVDCLYNDKDFKSTITQERFEDMCRDIFDSIRDTVRNALEDAGMSSQMIEQVVLIGGSTRIPRVRKILTDIFGKHKLNKTVNADEAVAVGAALFAEHHVRMGRTIVQDVASQSIVLQYGSNEKTIIKKNVSIPRQSENLAKLFEYAYRFEVYEKIKGLKKRMKVFRINTSRILDITLSVDESGILAVNSDSGAIEVYGDFENNLTRDQMADMIRNADALKEENNEWIERSKAKNSLEKLTYTVMQSFKSSKYRDKLTLDQQKNVSDKCDETLQWIEKNPIATTEEYRDRTEQLSEFLRKSVQRGQQVALVQQDLPIDLEKEEKRNAARYAFYTCIRNIREEALKLGEKEFVYNNCTKSERWLEDHMKEAGDVYTAKHHELKNRWERHIHSYQASSTSVIPRQSNLLQLTRHTSPSRQPMLTDSGNSFDYQTQSKALVQKTYEGKQQKNLLLLEAYINYVFNWLSPLRFGADKRGQLNEIFSYAKQWILTCPESSEKALEDMQQKVNRRLRPYFESVLQYYQLGMPNR